MISFQSLDADTTGRIARVSLSTQVHKSLKTWLSSGELLPGQKLAGRTLAEKLGVSQTPVREAMLQLVAERALTMNPNRSITVPVLNRETFVELRAIRVALEGLACRYAAEKAMPADVNAVERIHKDMIVAKRKGDYRSTLRFNRLLHFTVYNLSGSDELLAMIESLWARTGPYLNFIDRNVDPATIEPHAHEALIKGLRAKDPELCEVAIARDILEGGRSILGALSSANAS